MEAPDIKLFFNQKTKQYTVVSGEFKLKLEEAEYKILRGTMNGIALALKDKADRKKEKKMVGDFIIA